MRRVLLNVGMACILCACGANPDYDFTGSYTGRSTGNENGRPYAYTIRMTLHQTGQRISGTWVDMRHPEQPIGVVSGKAVGTHIKDFSFSSYNPGCEGILNGYGNVSDTGITGHAEGTTSLGPVNVELDLKKD